MKFRLGLVVLAGLVLGSGQAIAAGKKASAPPPPAWTFDPVTGTPSGNVRLVDYKVLASRNAGFFALYVQIGEGLPDGSRWTFQVAPADNTVKVGGAPFTVSGVWANWSVDCAAKTVRPLKFVWVGPDGAMKADVAVPRSVTDPATGWTRPPGDAGVALADQLCPADLDAAIMGNISAGLYPVEQASALAAIRASRSARNLSAPQRATAMRCAGLVGTAQELLGAIPLDPGSYAGAAGKLSMLSAMISETFGRSRPAEAELQAARAQWQPLAQRTRQNRSGKELTPELNACVAALPLGVAASPFALK